MTYHQRALPRGARGGFVKEGGQAPWAGSEQPGWVCDRDIEHFQAATPPDQLEELILNVLGDTVAYDTDWIAKDCALEERAVVLLALEELEAQCKVRAYGEGDDRVWSRIGESTA